MKNIVLVLFFLILSFEAHAQSRRLIGSGSYRRNSSGSENVSWNLADWMSQKQQFKVMDQWLAINTQRNFFEFGVRGSQTKYDVKIGGNTREREIKSYSASIYVSIFGIEGGVDESDEDFKDTWGQFNVRMLGRSSRDTSLVLGYGMRKREDEVNDVEFTNQYGNVKLQLYIFSFFGLDGSYRKDFRAQDQQHTKYEGEKAEYGAFIDLDFVRLYGRIFKETVYKTPAGGTTEVQTRDGTDAGVRLFF